MEYRIINSNELNHYGVRGMKWGVRKQIPLVGRRSGQPKKQMSPEQRSQIRKSRAKKAAKIGATLAVAGLAVYGAKKVNSIRNYEDVMTRYKRTGQPTFNLADYSKGERSIEMLRELYWDK